jgi:hypothetical protein
VATATRREDRGAVKTHKKTPIFRAAHRQQNTAQTSTLQTAAGDSVFMRKTLEAVKRELRATGNVADRDAYRSLANVRARVDERYQEAIRWSRQQGRDEEARRLGMMRRNLPPVRSEKQLIAEALMIGHRGLQERDGDQSRRSL